jgi:hypothetical protein
MNPWAAVACIAALLAVAYVALPTTAWVVALVFSLAAAVVKVGLRASQSSTWELRSLRGQPCSQDWDVSNVFAVPLVNSILVAAVIVEEPTVNPRNVVEAVGQLSAGSSGRDDRSHDF